MKKLSIVAVIIVAAVAFTSCASSGKYFSNAVNVNETQTQVVLSQANYKVVKDVSTVVMFTQKFKFNSKQLYQSAYNALREEAALKGSQALINVTLEEVNQAKYNLNGTIRSTKQAILVSGTVIEFTK
ncbi:MAG: hypothetical protein IJW01_00930 [Paludibacteraceae bacterium]|nr:hypothetical protein [Paludibacteraceae bacterium]